MNLYLVVEGTRTETKLYYSWLQGLLPDLERIYAPEEVETAEPSKNLLFMVGGQGYPSYLERIKAAVKDINTFKNYHALLICVDAEEEFTVEEKLAELAELTKDLSPTCQSLPIIHNVCIETWLLGNRTFFKRHPQSSELQRLIAYYDVYQDCPEKMTAPSSFKTVASFHLKYFKLICEERHTTYSKQRPGDVAQYSFLREVIKRHLTTDHLPSVATLVAAFSSLGLPILREEK